MTAFAGTVTALENAPTSAATSPSLTWAVKYVGGKAAPANASATPFTVGVIEPIGTAAGGYTGLSQVVQAAGNYVNKQLGGISGHPLKLVPCQVTGTLDAQRCGEQFANNPKITAVVNGVNIFDDTAELSALAVRSIPIFLPTDVQSGELSDKDAVAYGPPVTTYFAAMAQYMAQQVSGTNDSVSLINPQNAGGTQTASIMKQLLTADHVTNLTQVDVPETGQLLNTSLRSRRRVPSMLRPLLSGELIPPASR